MKKIFLNMLLILVLFQVNGQENLLKEATLALKENNLELAKTKIDELFKDETMNTNAMALYYRGGIYKEIYKQQESTDFNSTAREEAIQSLREALKNDSDGKYASTIQGSLNYLASKYYNDAGKALGMDDITKANDLFKNYQQIMEQIGENEKSQTKQKEYLLARGSAYTKKYNLESDPEKRSKHFEGAKNSFEQVLAMDPKNLRANYNMGVLYYNEAVNLIKTAEYDLDLLALSEMEDKSILLFKKSLPFMQTAFEIDPINESAIEGLSGIYFSLKQYDKSKELQQKLEEIKSSK